MSLMELSQSQRENGMIMSRNFSTNFTTEVGKKIVGESDAIDAAVEAIINGDDFKASTLLLGGLAGVGKTTLELAIANGIGDVNVEDKEEFVRIPVNPRLTFEDVFGGMVTIGRNIYDENGNVLRTYTEQVPMKGLITEKAKVVIFDEIEKGSEMVQNGSLEVAEEKQITTTAGTTKLSNYLITIMTQNGFDPLGSNTDIANPLSSPLASRIGVGAIMGDTNEKIPGKTEEIDSTIIKMLDGNGKSIKMEKFVTLDELQEIRRYASQISRKASADKAGVHFVRKAHDTLVSQGILEGYNRMAVQIGEGSRAIAAAKGEPMVTEEIIGLAARRVVLARLIARSILSASDMNELASSIIK